MAATASRENRRPSDAATIATWRAPSEVRSSRCCMLAHTRSGTRSATSSARPSRTSTRASSSRPRRSSTSRKGLPPVRSAMSRSRIPGSAARMSAATWATAVTSSGPRSILSAPDRVSRSNALRTPAGAGPGRVARIQPTGTVASRPGRTRRAAAVALSAHCRSSRQIRRGPASAACSSDACRSCRNQYDGSGEPCGGRIESPARIGASPPDSAPSKGASGTIEAPGSAAPLPTRIDSREPIAAISSRSRLLPMPARPSMTRTVPAPDRRRSSCDPIVLSISLRPRSGSNDSPRAASSPWRVVPRTPAVRPGSAAAAPAPEACAITRLAP